MDTGPESFVIFLQLLSIVLLVMLNGFFVAAEFSIVKVRSSQLEALEESRGVRPTTVRARKILQNLDAYLAATQLGITIASLALGWVGETVLNKLLTSLLMSFDLHLTPTILHAISIGTAFVLITFMHIIFGELAPKSIAISKPVRVILFITWPLTLFHLVFRPAIFVLNGLANLFLKLFGISMANNTDLFSEEELKLIINESHESGAIEETERRLIENVFDFDERRVFGVLTPRKEVCLISKDETLQNALVFAVENHHSRYPVYDGNIDNVVGMLYTKRLLAKLIETEDSRNESIAELVQPPLFVSENALIKNLLKRLQENHMQLAIVTDEVGEFCGVVSIEDILEELVGDIQDEFDAETPTVKPEGENSWFVDAHRNITEINRLLPYPFDESDDYDTLAGLIYDVNPEHEMKIGDVIKVGPYRGTIMRMFRNSVEFIKLDYIPPEPVEETDEDDSHKKD